jgi:hypothetical protein
MMEHPFVNDADDKTEEELLDIISGLNKKLVMAGRMNNPHLIGQLTMAVNTYRDAYRRKMSEKWDKESGNSSGHIDIQ